MKRIAIFAALPWECSTVARHLRNARRTNLGGHAAWNGASPRGEVWLLRTGIGPERADRAARALLAAEPFDLCVSTGCAGALRAGMDPGDLTLATEIVAHDTGPRRPASTALIEEAREIARRHHLRAHAGPVLCSSSVLATPADTEAAARHSGALAVEMEGAPLARQADERGLLFLSVRAILDPLEAELAGAGDLVDPEQGGVRPFAVARLLARRPSALGGLLEARRLQRASAYSLERFFAGWLSTLG